MRSLDNTLVLSLRAIGAPSGDSWMFPQLQKPRPPLPANSSQSVGNVFNSPEQTDEKAAAGFLFQLERKIEIIKIFIPSNDNSNPRTLICPTLSTGRILNTQSHCQPPPGSLQAFLIPTVLIYNNTQSVFSINV